MLTDEIVVSESDLSLPPGFGLFSQPFKRYFPLINSYRHSNKIALVIFSIIFIIFSRATRNINLVFYCVYHCGEMNLDAKRFI